MSGQGRHDLSGDFVLYRKNVLELAVVAFGPKVLARRGIDELRGDAHPVSGLAHAALDDIGDAERAANVLDLRRLALVMERRCAADHEQRAESDELGDDLVGDAVGEIVLLRVVREIGERQHGDRGLVGQRQGRVCGCRCLVARCRCCGSLGAGRLARADLPVEGLGRRVRRDAQLPFQRLAAEPVLAERLGALARSGVKAHEGTVGGLVERIGGQEPFGRRDGLLVPPVRLVCGQEPSQHLQELTLRAPALGRQPIVECRVADLQAGQEFAAIERRRAFQIVRRLGGGEG